MAAGSGCLGGLLKLGGRDLDGLLELGIVLEGVDLGAGLGLVGAG
jgi:hypothetical protein